MSIQFLGPPQLIKRTSYGAANECRITNWITRWDLVEPIDVALVGVGRTSWTDHPNLTFAGPMDSVGLVSTTVKLGRVRSLVCALVSSGRAQVGGRSSNVSHVGVPYCGAPREWEPRNSSPLSRLDAGPRSRDRGGKGSKDQRTERAASRMSLVVASGCEIIATCDALTSTTVACARAAMKR